MRNYRYRLKSALHNKQRLAAACTHEECQGGQLTQKKLLMCTHIIIRGTLCVNISEKVW